MKSSVKLSRLFILGLIGNILGQLDKNLKPVGGIVVYGRITMAAYKFRNFTVESSLSSHSLIGFAVMLQKIKFFAITYSSIALTFILQPGGVRAANIKYEFTVDFPATVFNQPLLGQQGSGYLIFDDASNPVLTETPEDIQLNYFEVEQLRFSLLGQTFTENDDVADSQFPYRFPLVAFGENRLQGLDFVVNQGSPTGLGFGFAAINSSEEFISVSDGEFIGGIGAQAERDGFDSNNNGIGFGIGAGNVGLSIGRVKFRNVPLSENVVGCVLSLGFGLPLLILKQKRRGKSSQ